MKDADTFRLLDAVGSIAAVVIVIVVASLGTLAIIVWGPK